MNQVQLWHLYFTATCKIWDYLCWQKDNEVILQFHTLIRQLHSIIFAEVSRVLRLDPQRITWQLQQFNVKFSVTKNLKWSAWSESNTDWFFIWFNFCFENSFLLHELLSFEMYFLCLYIIRRYLLEGSL